MMRVAILSTLAGALALSGCASAERAPACPAGQEAMRTATLFFGRNIGEKPGVSDAQFQKFVDEELTPRFPAGLTVLDGGGQWKNSDDVLIREASKVVVLVLPAGGDSSGKLTAARRAYAQAFKQDSVLLITQSACVDF